MSLARLARAASGRGGCSPPTQRPRESGYSMIELTFVAGLAITLTAMAIPVGASAVDEVHASAAARYLVTRFRLARLEAVKQSTAVGFRFRPRDGSYDVGLYVDGNGDGLRTRDIGPGVDSLLGTTERLPDRFPGVDFGFLSGVPAIDEAMGNADPIRLGTSDILSFSPVGSASSGTVYIRGRGQQQYAIRVLGVTGRVRLWRFNLTTRTWNPR